ncbi:MAG: ribosome maturation factor RimP [Gammaproteobacteria bacterium]|nr:ribosome maturation factor RimP [Gammaproteobacteria bacterium]MBU1414300.1 ribosome maturation factor RimP [Gammaproteobacteria bacterium]
MQLAELIEQAVSGLGYELVDFETSPRARLLRVFIDRLPEKGKIDIDDCTAVSNHLSRLFVVENVDYDRLEVSSPGLDRPLKKAADWQRFAGLDVQFKLRVPVGNQRNFTGRIVGLGQDGDAAVIAVEGEEREFLLAGIDKARLVPKF